MKRQKLDLTEERNIITYMIMEDRFLREIIPMIHSRYFQSTYARVVSGWVKEYWQKYKEAPGKVIQDIYSKKSQGIRDEEEAETVAEFLARLSENWGESRTSNVEYSLQQASHYLRVRSLECAKEDLEESIVRQDPLKGEAVIANFQRVAVGSSGSVSMLRDSVEVSAAYLDEDEILFSFPGALGKVVGYFARGDLVSYLSFTNRGKSWWQWYTAQMGMYLGLKTVFITLEMPRNQMVRRAWQSMVGSPRKGQKVVIPYFEWNEGEGLFFIRSREENRKAVNVGEIADKQKSFRFQFRSGSSQVQYFPAYSATVDDLVAYLDGLEYYERFVPDIVVVDYADIIAPTHRGEYRHQIDDIWKRLRRLAQERNILLVTASQSGRSTARSDAREEDVAEDIRKLAHCSKMISLNQTRRDYEQGIMRVNQLKERDGRRSYHTAMVLQCLDIGRPCLDSKMDNEVLYDK